MNKQDTMRIEGFDLFFDNCKPIVAKLIADLVDDFMADEEHQKTFGKPLGKATIDNAIDIFGGRTSITVMTEPREIPVMEAINKTFDNRSVGESLVRVIKKDKHLLPPKVARWVDDLMYDGSENYLAIDKMDVFLETLDKVAKEAMLDKD